MTEKEGFRQRIEKMHGITLDWMINGNKVLTELDKTYEEIEQLPGSGEGIISKDDVLKALSNPKIPRFGLKEANQPTGKFINLNNKKGEK